VADVTLQNSTPNHEIFLGEEEISDVSLSTFYVFDKENAAQPQLGEKVAWRGCGCGYLNPPRPACLICGTEDSNASWQPPPLMRDRSRRDHDLKMLPLRW
jgi:hypothetical protein